MTIRPNGPSRGSASSKRGRNESQSDHRQPDKRPKQTLQTLNAAIGSFSRKRKFGEALAHFHRIRTSGLQPNATSFVQVINACANAGQTAKAWPFWLQYRRLYKGKDTQTSTMIAAAMIKGFAGELHLRRAYQILQEFCSNRFEDPAAPLKFRSPGPRMLNAFVRGALRVGAVQETYKLVRYFCARDIKSVSMTALTGTLNLLTLAGQITTAEELYEEALPLILKRETASETLSSDSLIDLADLYAHTRCLVLLAGANKDKKQREMRHREAKYLLNILRQRVDSNMETSSAGGTVVTEITDMIVDADRDLLSRDLFFQHKIEELDRELQTFQPLPSRLKRTMYVSPASDSHIPSEKGSDACPDHLGPLSKEAWDAVRSSGALPGMSDACLCLTNVPSTDILPDWDSLTVDFSTFAHSESEGLRKFAKEVTEVLCHLRCCRESSKSRLVVELGCGSGDWICAEAAANPSDLYVANELRWDRSLEVMRKRDARKLRNLIIIGGDGTAVLERFVSPGSVDMVHVNFPEPPHVNDGPGAWISARFFQAVHSALRPQRGEIQIMSDQKLFMEYVSGALVKPLVQPWMINEGVEQAEAQKAALERAVFESLSFDRPWHFCKADSNGVSYFDRLWRRGEKNARYLMRLRRRV